MTGANDRSSMSGRAAPVSEWGGRRRERRGPFRPLLDDAFAQDVGDRLGAVAGAQLAEDVADVGLHRALSHHEFGGDLPVGIALGQLPQNVHLPRRSFSGRVISGWKKALPLQTALKAAVRLAAGMSLRM